MAEHIVIEFVYLNGHFPGMYVVRAPSSVAVSKSSIFPVCKYDQAARDRPIPVKVHILE